MAGGISITTEFLWRGALLATVPAVLMAVLARWIPARPATRHTLWLVALSWFVAAPMLPPFPMGFRSDAEQPGAPGLEAPIQLASEASPPASILNPPTTGARSKSIAPYPLARARLDRGRRSTLRLPDSSSTPDIAPTVQWMPTDENPCADEEQVAVQPPMLLASPDEALRWTPDTVMPPIEAVVKQSWSAVSSEFNRWWGQCLTGLGALRDGAAEMPPIPWYVWLGGIITILAARLLAFWRFVRYLNRSTPAPLIIQRQVRACARQMGLRQAPQTRMIDGACSPMICGFGRRSLLLPTELWSQLDDVAREAIIFHELAHLRRRDHWVRGVESLLSAVYWWHPIIWWLRSKLHEEAEVCCDAWVTWLMPRSRRVYAEALLQTHHYIQTNRPAVPSVGLGAASVRARTFARRITMVMRANGKPGISAAGIGTIAALMVAAWCATPVWSCPKDEKCDKKSSTHQPLAAVQPAEPTDAIAPAAPAEPTAPLPPNGESMVYNVLGAMPSLVQPLLGVTTTDQDRPRNVRTPRPSREELEARLERLERQLEELNARFGTTAAAPHRVVRGGLLPAAPPALRIGRLHVTPAPMAPHVVIPAMPPTARLAPLAQLATMAAQDDGEKVWRSYHVSEGKLEALAALMTRNDVPVLVRSGEDKIEVQATEAQHEIFKAFVQLIDPKDGDGGQPGRAPRAEGRGASRADVARAMREVATAQRQAEAKMKTRIQGKLKRRSAEAHEADIEKMEEKHDEISDRVGELSDRIAEIREHAQELAGEAKQKAMREADQLRREAQEMARAARDMARQIKDASRQLAELERHAAHEDDADAADDEEDEVSASGGKGQNWYQRGYQLHTERKYDEAIECFKKSAEAGDRKADSIYNIACGYSLKGDKDKAIEWLHKAWAAGYRDVGHMEQDSDLDNIRKDARYKKLIARGEDKDSKDDED